MDVGQAVYTLVEVYVTVLVLVSLLTVAWLLELFRVMNLQLAGLWFGVGGFGVLVVTTFVLVHVTRD